MDDQHTEGGDLGLGDGLKPGGLRNDSRDASVSPVKLGNGRFLSESREDSYSDSDLSTLSADFPTKTTRFLQRIRRRQKTQHVPNSGCNTVESGLTAVLSQNASETCLSSDDVSSIKEFKDNNGTSRMTVLDNGAVQKKLQQTQQEVDGLKQELELCEKQLDAKYRAMHILQQQLLPGDEDETTAVHTRDVSETNRVKSVNRELQKQINSVQFEFEYRQSCLLTSQEVWANRFDRVSQENVRLLRELEEKSGLVKKLHAAQIAWSRERDELLALVDVKERRKFESLSSELSSEDCSLYTGCGPAELAVLGACRCAAVGPGSAEPCTCARAAANMTKLNTKLQTKVCEQGARRDEAAVVADVYRVAFEEQLAQNRELIQRLGDLSLTPANNMSRTDKAKAAVKWLIKQLNEGTPASSSGENRTHL